MYMGWFRIVRYLNTTQCEPVVRMISSKLSRTVKADQTSTTACPTSSSLSSFRVQYLRCLNEKFLLMWRCQPALDVVCKLQIILANPSITGNCENKLLFSEDTVAYYYCIWIWVSQLSTFREQDGHCLLNVLNVALARGSLISAPSYAYYEAKEGTRGCSSMYSCSNNVCIDFSQVCNGAYDCLDGGDETNCSSAQTPFQLTLTGGQKPNEGLLKVTGKWHGISIKLIINLAPFSVR